VGVAACTLNGRVYHDASSLCQPNRMTRSTQGRPPPGQVRHPHGGTRLRERRGVRPPVDGGVQVSRPDRGGGKKVQQWWGRAAVRRYPVTGGWWLR
jgi:hypothetical protein